MAEQVKSSSFLEYLLSISKNKSKLTVSFTELSAGIHAEPRKNQESLFTCTADGFLIKKSTADWSFAGWSTKFPSSITTLFKVMRETTENYLEPIPLTTFSHFDKKVKPSQQQKTEMILGSTDASLVKKIIHVKMLHSGSIPTIYVLSQSQFPMENIENNIETSIVASENNFSLIDYSKSKKECYGSDCVLGSNLAFEYNYYSEPKLLSDHPATSEPQNIQILVLQSLLALSFTLILFFSYRSVKRRRKKRASLGLLQVSNEILGYGSQGTVVFKGTFGKRQVAVKRLLLDFYDIADQEVSLLQQSDHHPNVIRYYCKVNLKLKEKEIDDKFMFIGLELCICSIGDLFNNDLVSAKEIKHKLDPMILMREITQGLAHLHKLKIVHRDLKPQNVLVASNYRVVISDFGLCKKLKEDQTFFTNTAGTNGFGSIGWRAPELILSEEVREASKNSNFNVKITRSIDIFACGCLFYYILTEGFHPFGEPISRESNIATNTYDISKLPCNESKHLVEQMISREAEKRPDSTEILKHPFFWDAAKRLNFLQDLSDRLEIDDGTLTAKLEKRRRLVCESQPNWHKSIDPVILGDLLSFRHYSGHSLRDLLRAIRNKVKIFLIL